MSKCELCPRRCGADRERGERGICGEGAQMRVSRIALHPYEEPPISGRRGSGTVFFCGCSLGCMFCQNRDISRGQADGKLYTAAELADEILRLQSIGAENINLVTAAHFANRVAEALELVRGRLNIPVVYNTSGYERVETLRRLEGLVDIYMPDFKYASSELAEKYSSARNYPQAAEQALCEMYRQVGDYAYGDGGMLTKGVLVRHLVLPGARHDSIEVLTRLAEILPVDGILLSLMRQYTPDFAYDAPFPELHRKITSFEYTSVLRIAAELGFEGFSQSADAASRNYTPNFK